MQKENCKAVKSQVGATGKRIQGSGTIAARLECDKVVELCETEQAALLVKAAQCGRYCSRAHFVHHRKEPKAPQFFTVGYGRDRD